LERSHRRVARCGVTMFADVGHKHGRNGGAAAMP
jgi:hypothetical protein